MHLQDGVLMANGINSLNPDKKGKTREQVAKIYEAKPHHISFIDIDPEAVGTGSENLLDSLGALMGGNPLVVREKYGIPGQFYSFDPEFKRSNFGEDTANPDEDHMAVVLREQGAMNSFEGPPSSWSWADRAIAMHEFGHGMDHRNILSPELEYALSRVPGDFYDRRMLNPDGTSRTRNLAEKVGDAFDRALRYSRGPKAPRFE